MRLNLSCKYRRGWRGIASRGGETANLKELTDVTKQRVKVRLNLINTGTAANLHSKWLNCGHERRASKTAR